MCKTDKFTSCYSSPYGVRFLLGAQFAITKEWEWGQEDWGHREAEAEHRRKARRQYHIDDNKERMARMRRREERKQAMKEKGQMSRSA